MARAAVIDLTLTDDEDDVPAKPPAPALKREPAPQQLQPKPSQPSQQMSIWDMLDADDDVDFHMSVRGAGPSGSEQQPHTQNAQYALPSSQGIQQQQGQERSQHLLPAATGAASAPLPPQPQEPQFATQQSPFIPGSQRRHMLQPPSQEDGDDGNDMDAWQEFSQLQGSQGGGLDPQVFDNSQALPKRLSGTGSQTGVARAGSSGGVGGGGGEAAAVGDVGGGGVMGLPERHLDPDLIDSIAAAEAEEEAEKAREDGLPQKEVARVRKVALREALKRLKERVKNETKERNKAIREATKQAKLQQKEADKQAKQAEKNLTRALSGGGSDPVKHMVVLVSPRFMELPWVSALLTMLQDHKIEYKVDSSMALSTELCFLRWARRVPRDAAPALMGTAPSQGGEDGQVPSLQPITVPGASDPATLHLAFPLLMVFLTPQQLVAALPPAQAVGGAPHKLTYPAAARGGGSGGALGWGLEGLRNQVSRAYPQCTLTVCCVGLDKELSSMERAPGSTFNAGVVRNQFLDLQLTCPAIRLREDLLDGGMACDVILNTTKSLGQHHRKQQGDGYLDSHHQSCVSRHHPGLRQATAGQRTLAVALGHLLPPARAVSLAMQHTSLPALMRVLTNPALGVRAREEALMTHSMHDRAATIGKTSSKVVHDFLTQQDPNCPCRTETLKG